MENSYDGKRFESKCEKELYQGKLLSFYASFVQVEWKVNPFYVSNVAIG